jgi:hypothetical protein
MTVTMIMSMIISIPMIKVIIMITTMTIMKKTITPMYMVITIVIGRL